MTRQTKTERQRAEEALAVAQRKRERLAATVEQLERDLKSARADLAEAERLYAYRAQHPALPSTTTTNTEENLTR